MLSSAETNPQEVTTPPMAAGVNFESMKCRRFAAKRTPGRLAFVCLFPGVLFLPPSFCRGTAHPSDEQQGKLLAFAEASMRAGKFDEAAEAYQKLLEAQPNSAQLWSNLGVAYVVAGDCRKGLPALERAISLNAGLFSPWYFTGFCELQFHHDERALKRLARASSLNPHDANAWYLRAQAAANLGRLGPAFRAILTALALDPAKPEGYYRAGKTALSLAGNCYARVQAAPGTSPYPYRLEGERDAAQGVWDLAVSNYQKAVELQPLDAGVRFALGTAYLESGKDPQAEAEFRKCLELEPGSSWAKARLGIVLGREGKDADARRVLNSLRPEKFEAPEEFLDALTCAHLLNAPELGGPILREALARFRENLELREWSSRLASSRVAPAAGTSSLPGLSGQTSVGLSARFTVLSSAGEGNPRLFPSARAYREFRAAFLGDDILAAGKIASAKVDPLPEDPETAFTLGEVLHWLAFRFYDHVGRAFPASEAAQRLAAENFSAAGLQEKALEIYQGLLENGAKSADLLREIAKIYWAQHRWEEALKVLESLMQTDPYDPSTLVNVGRIYSYQQNLERAGRFFQRAAEVDPKMFEAHLGLGEILRRKGNDEGALKELLLACQLEPENPRPHYLLSQIYRGLDRKDLARDEMLTFQRLQGRAGSDTTQNRRELVPLE